MRHFTWAVTWMLVGLAVTLATASILQQKATIRVAAQPVNGAVPETVQPATNVKPKPSEPSRSLVVASRHHHVVE